jgi:hypothetical protein
MPYIVSYKYIRMIETINKTDLLDQIDEVVSQLIDLMSTLDENEVNIIPYKDSWTAGQLFQHITKSTEAIVKAVQEQGRHADRDPAENIANLKKTFLDFSTKLESPGFIVPEEGTYEKLASIQKLGSSFQRLRACVNDADLTVVVDKSPIGDATKLEMLHFVLYHTQRHLYQMKKIHEAIRNAI